jgi:hypothetical protein
VNGIDLAILKLRAGWCSPGGLLERHRLPCPGTSREEVILTAITA